MSFLENCQNLATQETNNIHNRKKVTVEDTRRRKDVIQKLHESLKKRSFIFTVLIENFYCFQCKSVQNACFHAGHQCEVSK